jgi:lysophospholipase L1-like esterase
MKDYSRRQFLQHLGAFSAVCLTTRKNFGDAAKPFEFLVVGDSVIWGQGLREEEKFYTLTKNWLETEIFKGARRVNQKVLAHSGASINLRDFEAEALERAEISRTEFFHREINVSFPSIHAQIDLARSEYENPAAVDLIMLMGGVTDVRLTQILNPLKSNDELRRDIRRHCGEAMFRLLKQTAEIFPRARVALVGYYPPLSKHSPASRIFSNLLALYNVPQPFKAVINNPLKRGLLKHYRQKMIERSLIWANDSTAEFKKAAARVNAESGGERVVFIKSPFTEENSLGAKNTLLYEIRKGKAQDALAAERKSVCRPTLDQLRAATDLDFRTRTCELATVGHPNPDGARAYAEAIQDSLRKFFEFGS